MLETCKAKLVPTIERLARDKDEYTASAVAALKQEIARMVPAICAQVSMTLRRSPFMLAGGPSDSHGPRVQR